ncbi:hypothetical protein ACIA8R_09545 [Nonomuraea sp. NPDC051191]|uniref:hypothetical protein n=1 Tax=Nonomuraea sp. NPDC051191 TaxID=3364372 RepID=UPI0037B572A7
MNIADLARVGDEELAGEPVGQASGAGARALMRSIMSEERVPEERVPVRRARRRALRRTFVLGAVAAGLAAVLAVTLPIAGPATEYANAAVTLKTGDDFIDVAITDPEADSAAFAEAFKAVGLDAQVRKIPVASQYAGMLFGPATPGSFPPGTGVIVTKAGTCASVWCGTVSMPTGYKGRIVFGIGRPAAPGERYAVIAPPGVPEPVPDGLEVRGKSVGEIRAELARRGLKIEYVVMWMKADGTGRGYGVDAQYVKDDWTADRVMLIASDTVQLNVKAGPEVPRDSLPRSRPAPMPSPWWIENE